MLPEVIRACKRRAGHSCQPGVFPNELRLACLLAPDLLASMTCGFFKVCFSSYVTYLSQFCYAVELHCKRIMYQRGSAAAQNIVITWEEKTFNSDICSHIRSEMLY